MSVHEFMCSGCGRRFKQEYHDGEFALLSKGDNGIPTNVCDTCWYAQLADLRARSESLLEKKAALIHTLSAERPSWRQTYNWIDQQRRAMQMGVEGLIVMCLCCAIARWLHDQECWVEV